MCAQEVQKSNVADIRQLVNEVRLLKRIRSDLVVKYLDCYETDTTVYVVMEKLAGGELFDRCAVLHCGN